MAHALALLLALAWPPSAAPDYAGIYSKGIAFAQFVDEAGRLKKEWQTNFAEATIDDESLARAKALKGSWRLLVVAEDWCHDSVSTVPYIARLVDASPDTLAMRLVHKDAGEGVIEAHKTPDGRAATPTIVVLDGDGVVKGVIAERPSALWEYSRTHASRKERSDWYKDDRGRHAIAEILDLIEANR